MSQQAHWLLSNRLLAAVSLSLLLGAGLSACGGGSGAASSDAMSVSGSSGTITAFGSVFVNGHEFGTRRALFIDDDYGTTANTAAGLEVGMVVDVKPAPGTTNAAPEASELRLHPLLRGYVDAVDTSTSTANVMGQKVQVNGSTSFSDHRACVVATTAPCTAVSSLSLLTATTSAAAPGTYVTVHGYQISGTSGSTNVVATLISASDLPVTNPPDHSFKVEGPLTFSGSVPSIGGLTLDFTTTVCKVAGTVTPCATAFSAGQVIAVGSASATAIPATSFAPSVARRAAKLPVQVVGQSIEVEGVVSSVNSSASNFVVRGITVDASAPGITLPSAGDLVLVKGVITGTAQSLSASALKVIQAAASVHVELRGNVNAATITGSGTSYSVSLLGQTVDVNAQTRLTDMSTRTWNQGDPATNPFNSSTFGAYLAEPTRSKHVIVRSMVNGNGGLTALSVAILPASAVAGLTGLVDASPAVSNSSVTGTPTTFSIHGVAVSADPAAIYKPGTAAMQTVAAGDKLVVLGTYSNNVLTVGATTTPNNSVVNVGPLPQN